MYIYKEYSTINLVILKSCMAVAIEKTENLYKPKKEKKRKNLIIMTLFLEERTKTWKQE